MGDARGGLLGPPHGTIPAAVKANKNKTETFKSSEHINEKRDGSYRGFGYLNVHVSLFKNPTDLTTWSQRELLYFLQLSTGYSIQRLNIIQMGPIFLNIG